MMKRRATAQWHGSATEGKGSLTAPGGVLTDTPYSFASRFKSEDGRAGTNPEELIAAAHAGCFTMALSFALNQAGFTADHLHTDATLTIVMEPGIAITGIHLAVTGKVPNLDQAKFEEIATGAKENCPVSKALAAVNITMEAKLS